MCIRDSPPSAENDTRLGEQVGVVPEGVEQLMVVLQVVYITLPTAPVSDTPNHDSRSSHQDLTPLAVDSIRVFEVDDIANHRQPNASLYRSAIHRRSKNHHITTVVNLYDTVRIKELLSLGTVTGCWTDALSRLRSLHYQSTAFCMDCLLRWWEKFAEREARIGWLKAKQKSLQDNDLDPTLAIDMLPDLVPAVRIKVQWQDLEEHSHSIGDLS